MKVQVVNRKKIESKTSEKKLADLFARAFEDVYLQVRVGGSDLMSASSPSKTGRCC